MNDTRKTKHGTLYSLFLLFTTQLFVFLFLQFVVDVYINHPRNEFLSHNSKMKWKCREKTQEIVVLNYITHTCAFKIYTWAFYLGEIVVRISVQMSDEASMVFRHIWTLELFHVFIVVVRWGAGFLPIKMFSTNDDGGGSGDGDDTLNTLEFPDIPPPIEKNFPNFSELWRKWYIFIVGQNIWKWNYVSRVFIFEFRATVAWIDFARRK